MDAINFQSAVARLQQSSAARAYAAPANRTTAIQSVKLERTQHASTQNPVVQAARARIVGQLVAGTVHGGVDFGCCSPESGEPQPSVLAMYTHPADKNTVATSIYANGIAGRAIDIEG